MSVGSLRWRGQKISAGTSSGGSTFQSSSFCQGIAVWVGLCMKYHAPWSSPTSMSSSVGQQLLQLQVCSNGCVSSAHWIPNWNSRFLVLWESLRDTFLLFFLVQPVQPRLVFVAFSLFGWASADMLAWVGKFERSAPQDLPSRNIRPWLSNGLIIDFLLYGVVYMSSMLGLIDAHTERKGFFVLTFGSKIAYCAAFVFIRADEYHKTLTFCEKSAFPTWACWQHIRE